MPFGIWLRGVAVLVDQTTEDLRPSIRAIRAGSLSLAAVDRRALLESMVPAVIVVVGLVLRQLVLELALVEDKDPVKALAADGADPPFGVSVGLRRDSDEPYLPVFVLELSMQAMVDLALSLANYLAQPFNGEWDGTGIVQLVA